MKFKKFLCILMTMLCIFNSPLPIGNANIFDVTASAATQDKLPSPKTVKFSVKGAKVTLSWSKVSGADAYRIYKYDRAKQKFVRLKTVKGNKTSISELTNGKHYFKIVPVEISGKKFTAGKSSKMVTVTIKSGTTTKPTSTTENNEQNTSLTAVQLAKEMGKGWNLGNTMESVASWLYNPTPQQFETAWGQPVTTKEMITGLKKAGINSVRIPIAWSNMMEDDYKISEEYFERIDEIVGYVLDNDMYCIINIHWDGGWWEGFGSSDTKIRNATWDKFESMWEQIAKHYKDYPDKLIFESANEELGSKTQGSATIADSYKRVTEINQTFVDIVRKSGSKNKERFLLIAGYDTDIDKTCNPKYVMPTDTAKNKLLISVHYYSPSPFCIAEKSNNSWGYMGSWGTDSDKNTMRKDFEKMTKFTEAGYGVIIGEYGVTHCTDNGQYIEKEGTDEFFRYVVELSKEYGYCSMLWDCNDWYKRSEGKFTDKDIAAIYK